MDHTENTDEAAFSVVGAACPSSVDECRGYLLSSS